jgi:excisionase family DNA binding protein
MNAHQAFPGQTDSSIDSKTGFNMKREPRRLESMMEDRWLSVDEIAAYLGIKRDTVYKWIAEKQMPAHRMGRLWKLRKEEVDEWVKSGGADENKDKGEQ